MEMVQGDWREKAKRLLEERIRDGGRVSFFTLESRMVIDNVNRLSFYRTSRVL